MCERCRVRAEKALRQGTGFRVTPGEAAKLEEILDQMDELEKKRALWWEKQLTLAGFPEGNYQILLSEGVIVRRELWDMDILDELEDLADELSKRRGNPNLRLI